MHMSIMATEAGAWRPELRMADLLTGLATQEGIQASPVEGVDLIRATHRLARTPVLYEPGIIIVGRGRKLVYLGDRMYVYDAHNYLVLSVPLPLECETESSPEEPMLAVRVRVDLAAVAEMLLKMGPQARPEALQLPRGIYSTRLDATLSAAVVRLLECMSDCSDARVLGPHLAREIVYRVLRGEQGHTLRAAAALHSRFGQINAALQRIHSDYALPLSVESLAETAGMSVSVFHQNFKAVTSTSPLQYLKTIRLHKARLLMVVDGVRAGIAAERVGYESASQFSREFRRLFGASPVEETGRVRDIFGGGVAPEPAA
jgi:AraC-like DNA-binding protein